MFRTFIILVIYSIAGCNDVNRTIEIGDNLRAVGNINEDSIYNGIIKFYDNRTNKLVKQYTYKNGLREGKATEFHQNGEVSVNLFFSDNKRNGFAFYYDLQGKIIAKDFYYYDLRVGPSFDYQNDLYQFLSLSNDVLMTVNFHDLEAKKKVTDIIENYFFFHTKDYSEFTAEGLKKIQTEYFLYTPNPPEYNFQYSLVIIDGSYNILSILETFDRTNAWSTFTLPKISSGNNAAVRLQIKDIDGSSLSMFKILK